MWHPIEYAFRTAPDQLTLVDPHTGFFGLIRRLDFDGDIWYRGTTWADEPRVRILVGYSRDCRVIVMSVYRVHLNTQTTNPAPALMFRTMEQMVADAATAESPDRAR